MNYDGLNRMVSWSRAASGATLQTETHGYRGAEWHRRSTSADGTSTSFLYDGDNVLVDYVTSGGGGSTFDRLYVTPFLDQNLSMLTGTGESFYYSQDGLGTVRTLTDSSGAVKNRYDYLAFGEAYAPGTTVEVDQRYTYTGREKSAFDGQSAPMYYRYRHYAPGIGRFTARDPLGDGKVDSDIYLYAYNLPTGYVDALGLDPAVCEWLYDKTIEAIADHDKAETNLKNLEKVAEGLRSKLADAISHEKNCRRALHGYENMSNTKACRMCETAVVAGAMSITITAGASIPGVGLAGFSSSVLYDYLSMEYKEAVESDLIETLGKQKEMEMLLHQNGVLHDNAQNDHDDAANRRDYYREACDSAGCCHCP